MLAARSAILVGRAVRISERLKRRPGTRPLRDTNNRQIDRQGLSARLAAYRPERARKPGHARTRSAAWLMALVVLFPGKTFAADQDPWNLGGWTPSVSLALGLMSTGKVDGSVRSVDSFGTEIRPPSTGEDFATTPIAAATLGLDSPTLERTPLSPSFFVRASILPTFKLNRYVANEGAVAPFDPPQAFTFTAPAITGQGAQTEISTNLLAYSISTGVSIPVQIAGRRFRVRPGVSWMRFAFDIRGDLHHAVKPVAFGTSFRAVDLNRHGKLYLNGIGPYLEIESFENAVEITRAVRVGFFAEAAVYRVLGDRRANLGLVSSFDDAFGTDTYTTQWSIEADEWFYRFGAGIRIYLASRDRSTRTSR